MWYSLTSEGETAEPRTNIPGKIIQVLQEKEKESSINPERMAYLLDLDVITVKQAMESLVRAGYLVKEDEQSTVF